MNDRVAVLPDLQPGQAVLVDWSFDRYLSASEYVSRSALDDLITEGPAYYYAKHIARTIRDKETAAMVLGRYLHMRLLEPDRWAAESMVWEPLPRPAGANGKAKRDTAAYKNFAAWKQNTEEWEAKRDAAVRSGIAVIDMATAAKIEAMAESVLRHKFGAKMFRPGGANEATILWRHPETGILIRCRLDRLDQRGDDTVVIVDAKTTTNPKRVPFAKSITRYGYHRQGAIYTDAARALFPGKNVHFVIAAVRSDPPYEAAFYELGETSVEREDGRGPLALGREQYTRALHELAERTEKGNWTAEWQNWCSPIELPRGAYWEE